MIGIVVSEADRASIEIGRALRDLGTWTAEEDHSLPEADGGGTVYRTDGFELRTFETLHLDLQDVAETFSHPQAVVFVSKHAGDTGKLLSVHTPGNVGEAQYGGAAHEVPASAPGLMRSLFQELIEGAPPAFDVGIECTHHGPSRVGAPTCFIEVGSTAVEWGDEEPARAIARAVLACADASPGSARTVAGFGGGHYAPRFERILRETGWAVGHIAADWSLDEIANEDSLDHVIGQLLDRSGATVALVDGDRPELVERIEEQGTRVVSETWLREVDGVDLGVVEAVETHLGSIDEGVRLGAEASEATLESARIPQELVDIVNGYAPDKALAAVRSVVVGFRTVEGGTRLEGSIVVQPETTMRQVVDALFPILTDRYDTVAWDDHELVLRKQQFDPQRAATLGVPEGPAFGRLASGESVMVGDEVIVPEAVMAVDETRITLGTD